MQSAPSEHIQTTNSVEQSSSLPSHTLQHGLPPTDEQAFDDLQHGVVREPSTSLNDTDDASLVSAGSRRGRSQYAGRLSREASSSSDGSPGSRIDAYEKAHSTPRKPSDGMIFQIVPNSGRKQVNVSITDFPNEVLTHILSHLPPETLSMMSLVSKRFHRLVTTPPAWRIAFARYFPGSENNSSTNARSSQSFELDSPRTERRTFTRLSALASWRSEYILRTRLLRSLGRGRPAIQAATKSTSRQGGNAPAAAVITYSSGLLYPVSHIHATFGIGLNKKQPLFVHGASEQGAVSTSDPSMGKISNWGLSDFETFKHFADLFTGEDEYGLGSGTVVGMPNVMDLSQAYGKVYGEACPGGRLWFTSTSEQRGRFLSTVSSPNSELGIPAVTMTGCAVTAVWIAKSEPVLKSTNGIFGCLAGFSNGVLAAYALGVNPVHDRRFAHGEPTAKWCFCPGVPIIAINIDEKVSSRRLGNRRIWATVLNALGEVFYLTEVPNRPDFKGKAMVRDMDRLSWQTGRSVEWTLVESTRRVAKPDPFNMALVDGSYTPRCSSDVQGLSKEQIAAETNEVEKFLAHKPKHFRDICDGWDMRRKLVMDFAGDDHNTGGESAFIFSCGIDENSIASIKRITRRRTKLSTNLDLDPYPPISSISQSHSIFGTPAEQTSGVTSPVPRSGPRSRTSSTDDFGQTTFQQDWHISNFGFGFIRGIQITAIATDDSDFATLSVNEDPLLGMSGGSNTSSPISSPLGTLGHPNSPSEVPGRRARFMGIGTSTGLVLLWNMRSSISPAPDVVNTVQPLRYIYTKSPQISSLAMTALYLVHGGNDGLVQAWDPLASTTEPIRTLNSRFSDRARRRIAQAEASIHGVGNNYYAAGAIVLDPDPTVLRGMASLGTHLRYWHYSAGAADAYKSKKRGQLRKRSERGSNSGANEQRYHHTGRGILKDYIAIEKQELELEKVNKQKGIQRLTARFGTDLLGEDASEEEMLAYATMLSEEAFAQDEERFRSNESSASAADIAKFIESSHNAPISNDDLTTEMLDPDVEEAIRLSLLDTEMAAESPQTNEHDIPIKIAKSGKRAGTTPSRLGSANWATSSTQLADQVSINKNNDDEADEDLDFALRLSLAEQESRSMAAMRELDEVEFPALSASNSSESDGKGKGKKRSKRR